MISEKISRAVLTIGNRSDKPDGGISQVLYSYRQHVYPVFKSVVNFKQGNLAYKVLLLAVSYVQAFLKLLFDRKIQIVHIHTASDNGFRRNILFVNLAFIFGKKVVLHIHSGRFNDYYVQNKKQVDKVFGKCSAIVALTDKIKLFYESMGCANVYVINNIIEYPHIHTFQKEDDVIHMLYLGVITQTKGIFDLLDVIAEHKNEFYKKIILHVGGNKEVDTLLNIIEKESLQDTVIFEGWVSGGKKIELLSKCDVFVLPSYTEGLPISILEAQSYGLFTVATNVGGIPEIVNESNGRLFEPGNKPALYAILKELIENRSFVEKEQMIKDSVVNYLPEAVSDQLEALYCSLLS